MMVPVPGQMPPRPGRIEMRLAMANIVATQAGRHKRPPHKRARRSQAGHGPEPSRAAAKPPCHGCSNAAANPDNPNPACHSAAPPGGARSSDSPRRCPADGRGRAGGIGARPIPRRFPPEFRPQNQRYAQSNFPWFGRRTSYCKRLRSRTTIARIYRLVPLQRLGVIYPPSFLPATCLLRQLGCDGEPRGSTRR